MIRTFATHKIRKTQEISSCLWDFYTLPEQGKEEAVKGKAAVPGCWESCPDTRTYRGRACYERDISCSGNVRIEFKGVSHTAQVYLDGREIASHYNAYTPFSAVVKGLGGGKHHLKVIADNSFGPQSALHVPNDYQSYGGITRPVVLEELNDSYITGIHFTPVRKDGKWYSSVQGELQNISDHFFRGKVILYLGEQEIHSAVVEAGPDSKAAFTAENLSCGQAEEWSPENPVLYHLTAVLQDDMGNDIDDWIDRVGFREIRMEGKDILLNGRKIRIKGFCRHEDHPQFGCAIPFQAMQQDLMLMKDMGANSVRTSHYPNDELFLDLCDETGFLVWEENHARGLSEEDMRNPNFEKQCEDCIREMIEAHYNHPSIYIWGILNECASHTEYGKDCYQKQYDLIRKLDPSRPRSSASCQFKTDICFGMPEVVSYNIYPLWYHDTPADVYLKELYDWVQEKTEGTGKPFLVTEIGAGAIYGYRTPAEVKWSEEYQASAIQKQLTAVFGQEGGSGVYVWQFCDGRVCDSWFGTRPRTMNNKGIVDEYRRPKLSYETVKRIFRGLDTYVN
ncbi:glycoside hydrolase family 2 protein [Eisenbergiella tayi]|uniref:Beta-glucuronidase n=1 Tax=Eisenbergiella tayi TaxID=1432052 RepID=A0A1E3AEI5_9FIRM|nr:glycoside hydrolase family 2 TIM barrel-domain containing protein [Eisenbergiella tayi]ODM06997.1 Beta-glucuronidase [Eisenbergiella tayi]